MLECLKECVTHLKELTLCIHKNDHSTWFYLQKVREDLKANKLTISPSQTDEIVCKILVDCLTERTVHCGFPNGMRGICG
ncbi:MAG: hypothetical protein Sylvanvirus5_27 [Sylvanvirus sp.]|uniref:Uncharacterized protein n=1 Tax=Sylvanvirus sp. TaxID=2487774 RepID=A0A3G5AL28_9VIRU|nr:MAG: hypothetical protein Sylvanvirus5_27 [Sylvanvirus sp.]